MLKHRVLTASVLIPLVVCGIIYLNSHLLAVCFAIFVILAGYEWALLCGWSTGVARSLYAATVAVSLIITYWAIEYYSSCTVIYLLLIACGWWLLALQGLRHYQRGTLQPITSAWLKALIGLLILIPSWSALWIVHAQAGKEWLLFLLVLIWAADSGAYFVGKQWGRVKLADQISPGKTVEGVVGGLIVSGLVAIAYALLEPSLAPLLRNEGMEGTTPLLTQNGLGEMTPLLLVAFVFSCLITVIASIVGDLVESAFKRQAGVKDSGSLFPGHGGVLDRIDSMTAAAPVFTLSLVMLGIIS